MILFSVQFTNSNLTSHAHVCHYTSTTAKSAEQAAKAVTAETQSTKRAAVTAPVPFSSEDNVPQEYSAPAPAQASAPVTAAAAAPAETFSNSDRRLEDDSVDFSNSNEAPSGTSHYTSSCTLH
jgi:hypothetical protein